MIVDGKSVAASVYARLPKGGAKLGILVGTDNPVIQSFVRIKEKAAAQLGVEIVREELRGAGMSEALDVLNRLVGSTDGVVVQLPLPDSLDTDAILAAIPPEKDVDGISPTPQVRPPVAGAVNEILEQAAVQVHDVEAVVVGAGRLVGAPVAQLLRDKGARVTVLQRGDSLDALKYADIVVLGAGEPGLVKPDHLKRGVVLIDAGTSEAGGKISGDADPSCADVAAVFTPVPGGIGPIAVAMIFKNLFTLAGKLVA